MVRRRRTLGYVTRRDIADIAITPGLHPGKTVGPVKNRHRFPQQQFGVPWGIGSGPAAQGRDGHYHMRRCTFHEAGCLNAAFKGAVGKIWPHRVEARIERG